MLTWNKQNKEFTVFIMRFPEVFHIWPFSILALLHRAIRVKSYKTHTVSYSFTIIKCILLPVLSTKYNNVNLRCRCRSTGAHWACQTLQVSSGAPETDTTAGWCSRWSWNTLRETLKSILPVLKFCLRLTWVKYELTAFLRWGSGLMGCKDALEV